jgi:cardiolipin synthase
MIFINWVLVVLHVALASLATGHVLLNKNDPRSAWGWISFCVIFPYAGPFLYFLFGINRVRTTAKKLDLKPSFRLDEGYGRIPKDAINNIIHPKVPAAYQDIARISDTITRLPLVGGNHLEMLHNGEEVYPAMIEAMEQAESTLYFTTYLFETNTSGQKIMDALCRAKNRGVDVKVIIDGIGELYNIPRAGTILMKSGVKVARFLPPRLNPPTLHINLRNHRKILIADGQIGFTGGINIGDRYFADNLKNPNRVMDTHFKVIGPVVAQMEMAFLDDWKFVTGETIDPTTESPKSSGTAICRSIVDGPNEDPDKLPIILSGAISSAQNSVWIMTPYFLPSREIVSALQLVALKGIDVNVVLPAKNNFSFMTWAANNFLWKLMQLGVKVYFQPPPFVHSKLLVVDDYYTNIGSANIDPRSLRLNFELNIEIFDTKIADIVAGHICNCINRSTPFSLKYLENRSLPVKLRDALAWIFSPYM